MKKKPINPLIIGAVLCAAVAIYFVWKMDKNTKAELERIRKENAALLASSKLPPPPPKVVAPSATVMKKVVVAAVPIPAGKVLSASDFKIADVPQNLYPTAVAGTDTILFEADPARPGEKRLSGRMAFKSFALNEPIDMRGVGKRLGRLEDKIKVGMRVLSLGNVQDLSGGVIEDGSHVDLMFIYNDPALGERTTVVAQNLRVLLNGGQGNPSRQDPDLHQYDQAGRPDGIQRPGGVVFEVTPDQAQLLTQLGRSGSYSMLLRNPDDDTVASLRGVTKEEIVNNPKVIQLRSDKSIKQAEELQKSIESKNKETQ